jgi:hypothetical protein
MTRSLSLSLSLPKQAAVSILEAASNIDQESWMSKARVSPIAVFSVIAALIVTALTVFSALNAKAAVPNSPAADETTSPASTTVSGTAFGEKFTAGYAYAKRDPVDGTVFVMFGNGKTGGCDVTNSSETAYVGMNHPAKSGTYTATPAEAYFSNSSLEPRAFSSFKIDVKAVTTASVQGSIEMVSPKGTIAGNFNAVVCPGTN